MQFGAFLATTATENVNSVSNLDFGRSIWWHQVIKSGTENRHFIPSLPYRFCGPCINDQCISTTMQCTNVT